MAITDVGKLFETTSTDQDQLITVGATCKRDSTVVIFVGGEKSGTLGVSIVSDNRGNTWNVYQNPGSTMVAILWSRLSVALQASDWIRVKLSQKPIACWKSGHNFEGAAETAYDQKTHAGTSTQAYVTVNVTGSDWLALGMAYFPSDPQMTTTEVDSSVSQDDSGSAEPYSECWSYNGTTGTSTRIGATISPQKYRKVIGITLLGQPLGTARQNPNFFFGV